MQKRSFCCFCWREGAGGVVPWGGGLQHLIGALAVAGAVVVARGGLDTPAKFLLRLPVLVKGNSL